MSILISHGTLMSSALPKYVERERAMTASFRLDKVEFLSSFVLFFKSRSYIFVTTCTTSAPLNKCRMNGHCHGA